MEDKIINSDTDTGNSENNAAPAAGTDTPEMSESSHENAESDILARIEKYRNDFHATNRRRIRAGIRCLLTVPLIFLILLLMTGSDRIIFLVLWVISMFLISGYLIYVEYMDFKVDKMVADVTGRSFEEMHAVTAAEANESSSKDDKKLSRKVEPNDDNIEEHTEE